MSENNLAPERTSEPGESIKQLPFNDEDLIRDMSFTLKTTHEVHPVTLKCILDQFRAEVKATKDDETLDRNLAAFTERFLARALAKLKREDSPGYKALIAYLKEKNMLPETPVAAVRPADQTPDAEAVPAVAVENLADATSQATADVFREQEAPSSIQQKLPNILDMELDEAIRTFFPSISEMVLQAVRLKIMQGPSQEESGTLDWQEKYFDDLVSRFTVLREDLVKLGIPVGSAARLLFGRGHQEANRAESARMSRRGRMDTIVGFEVPAVQLAIATERVIAGLSLEKKRGDTVEPEEEAPSPVGASEGDTGTEAPGQAPDVESLSIHERVTAPPPPPTDTQATAQELAPAVPASERETVTNEANSGNDSQPETPTTVHGMDAGIVAAEVARARAAAQAQPKPAEEPPKQKKRRGRIARFLLGGDDDKEGGKE